jgi:hypothetical protein
LQREDSFSDSDASIRQAEVAALATGAAQIQTLRIYVAPAGEFTEAWGLAVTTPTPERADYRELVIEAEALHARMIDFRAGGIAY